MSLVHFFLAILIIGTLAVPRGNEAKTKKLMRNDHAESRKAVAIQVGARGGYRKGKLPGKLELADQAKVSSAENDVQNSAAMATCDNSDSEAGKVDCMSHNKCGNSEDTDWMIQCGYGTLHVVSGVCVLKSKDEELRKERCAVLGDGGKRGRLFCHEDELYVKCAAGKGLDLDLDSAVTHAAPNTATKSATTSTGGQQEVAGNTITQAEAISGEKVTYEEVHHSMDDNDVFANMDRDADVPYVLDTEENRVCKSVENITFTQDGTLYTVSYAPGSKGGKNKKCKVSKFIPAAKDPLYDSFKRGRLKLCAEYVALGGSTICGPNFWMTKDYHCYCSIGSDCDVVEEEDACLYQLNTMDKAAGAEATIEELQGKANHISAVNMAIKDEHKLQSDPGGDVNDANRKANSDNDEDNQDPSSSSSELQEERVASVGKGKKNKRISGANQKVESMSKPKLNRGNLQRNGKRMASVSKDKKNKQISSAAPKFKSMSESTFNRVDLQRKIKADLEQLKEDIDEDISYGTERDDLEQRNAVHNRHSSALLRSRQGDSNGDDDDTGENGVEDADNENDEEEANDGEGDGSNEADQEDEDASNEEHEDSEGDADNEADQEDEDASNEEHEE